MEEKRIAANGIPVYSLTNEHSHSFFISMFLKSGSIYESEKECGITHFLEHVAIRNINSLMGGGLYRLLDKYGLEFNASTYNEMVQFYISGADTSFAFAAEIISRLLSPISLSGDELDAERLRIKAEIREADDKSSLAYFTASQVWGNTPLSRPITGTPGSVSRISAKRIEEYRRRVFTKDNIFFYVTGNVNNDNLSYLTELIGGYDLDDGAVHDNTVLLPPDFGKREPRVHVKNADFTKIRYTFDVDMSLVTSQELDLLYDIVLGGYSADFFIELSEKRGLFYDLGGTVERYANAGLFSFSYELREAKLYDAAQMTVELLRGYAERAMDEDRCMKAGYVNNAYMLYDDTRELNFTFGYDNHILGLGYRDIEDRRRVYSSVTSERIREVAAIIFRPENLTVTLKGKKSKIDNERLEEILFGKG